MGEVDGGPQCRQFAPNCCDRLLPLFLVALARSLVHAIDQHAKPERHQRLDCLLDPQRIDADADRK